MDPLRGERHRLEPLRDRVHHPRRFRRLLGELLREPLEGLAGDDLALVERRRERVVPRSQVLDALREAPPLSAQLRDRRRARLLVFRPGGGGRGVAFLDLRRDLVDAIGDSWKAALQRRDWAAFAKGYNGTAYRENRYDERLAAAYGKRSKAA